MTNKIHPQYDEVVEALECVNRAIKHIQPYGATFEGYRSDFDIEQLKKFFNIYDEVVDALVWAAPLIKDERVSNIVQAALSKVKG